MDLFTFNIEKNNYAIPMNLIFEIIKAPAIVSAPKYPDFEGFINHRNIIYPVALLPGNLNKINIIVLMKVENEVIGVGIENMGAMAHTKDIQSIDSLGKKAQLAVVNKNIFYIVDPKVDLPSYERTFENDVNKLKSTGS